MAENKAHEALEDYQKSLASEQHLVESQPANNEWRSYLAIIREKTGEALVQEGRLVEALQEFTDSLSLCEILVAADPTNAERAENEALASFQTGITLSRISHRSGSDVREMLSRARGILLDLRQRFPLRPLDEQRLNEIQAALSSL